MKKKTFSKNKKSKWAFNARFAAILVASTAVFLYGCGNGNSTNRALNSKTPQGTSLGTSIAGIPASTIGVLIGNYSGTVSSLIDRSTVNQTQAFTLAINQGNNALTATFTSVGEAGKMSFTSPISFQWQGLALPGTSGNALLYQMITAPIPPSSLAGLPLDNVQMEINVYLNPPVASGAAPAYDGADSWIDFFDFNECNGQTSDCVSQEIQGNPGLTH